eukprot:883711_1
MPILKEQENFKINCTTFVYAILPETMEDHEELVYFHCDTDMKQRIKMVSRTSNESRYPRHLKLGVWFRTTQGKKRTRVNMNIDAPELQRRRENHNDMEANQANNRDNIEDDDNKANDGQDNIEDGNEAQDNAPNNRDNIEDDDNKANDGQDNIEDGNEAQDN